MQNSATAALRIGFDMFHNTTVVHKISSCSPRIAWLRSLWGAWNVINPDLARDCSRDRSLSLAEPQHSEPRHSRCEEKWKDARLRAFLSLKMRKAWNWRGCARDLARSAFWHRNVWSIPLNKKRNVTNGFGRWLFLLEMVSFCRSSGVHWSSCWSSNFKSIPGNTLHRDNLTSVRNSGCSG